MMKLRPFSILCHAVRMVRRNIRSYIMLSVTIILSFSILLGFMGYMDSKHYNEYKGRFARDRSLLSFETKKLSSARLTQLQEKAAEVGVTHSLQSASISITIDSEGWKLSTGEKFRGAILGKAYCLPRECWFLQEAGDPDIVLQSTVPVWLDGRDDTNITLEKGQILMDEQLYKALGVGEQNNEIGLSFYCGSDMSKYITGTFTVVGTIPSSNAMEVEKKENKGTGEKYAEIKGVDYRCALVFSLDDLNPRQYPSSFWSDQVIFYSDQPENVRQMLLSLEPDLLVHTVYEPQNKALETMQSEKATKALIAMLLLLILGINLYSSFQNALNERKFEIGVKRAVGASAFSIVRQFFYESMLVMLVNIAVTVALVVDIGLVLKLYREATYHTEVSEGAWVTISAHKDYILYITSYSVAMFAVCALVLTVVFSFIFAYKATRVQIVDYLKAE